MNRISVIIPTLFDDAPLSRLLDRLADMDIETVIICDAEARPEVPTSILPDNLNILYIQSNIGRGPQIKAGLAEVKTDYAWVLHADSSPHLEAPQAIAQALTNKRNSLLTFTLAFDTAGYLLSFYAYIAKWDSAFTTFGDQGFAFRLEDYRSLSLDLDHYPLLEDVALRSALKRKGRILRSNLVLTTSARRFEKHGIIKTQLFNFITLLRYWGGVRPQDLYRAYYGR